MTQAARTPPPRIKPTNMVKAGIKAAKDAGMEVVIEVGQKQARAFNTLSAKVRPHPGLAKSNAYFCGCLTLRRAA